MTTVCISEMSVTRIAYYYVIVTGLNTSNGCYWYQLALCSLVGREGSHYRAFMVTPLGCKNALSPSNQVVVIINRINNHQTVNSNLQAPSLCFQLHYGQ